jgi:hypothetical protein
MTIVVNSLGVEQLVGPQDSINELARNIERTSFGFKEIVRVPFDSTGLLTGESASIQDLEFGKGAIFLSADVIVTTGEAVTLNVGLEKAEGSRASDAFTADPDGLVAAGSLAAAGIVAGAGALIGLELGSRTTLTAAVSGGTTAQGYILIEFMGANDYFDNIDD